MRPEAQIKFMLAAGWLTPKEAAKRAGISTGSMYRLVQDKANGIETTQAPNGGALYISAPSLAKFYGSLPPIAQRIMDGMPAATSTPPEAVES